MVDDWYIYNNSGSEYELVAKNVDKVQKIINFEVFRILTNK